MLAIVDHLTLLDSLLLEMMHT